MSIATTGPRAITYARLELLPDMAQRMLVDGGLNNWGGRRPPTFITTSGANPMPVSGAMDEMRRFIAARQAFADAEPTFTNLVTDLRGLATAGGATGPYVSFSAQIVTLTATMQTARVAVLNDPIFLAAAPGKLALNVGFRNLFTLCSDRTKSGDLKRKLETLRNASSAIDMYFRGGRTIADESVLVTPCILRASGAVRLPASCAAASGATHVSGALMGGRRRGRGRTAARSRKQQRRKATRRNRH